MRVLIVLATELGKKLSDLELQIGGQRGSQYVRLLQLDSGLRVLVELVDDVAEPLEVGIDRAVERQLDVGDGEAIHVRIVVADLDSAYIGFGGPSGGRQGDEPDIHVAARCAWPLGGGLRGAGCVSCWC